MTNVFISYARSCRDEAQRIVDDVEKLGHSAWYDDELTGAQAWWDQILENIRNCDVLALVMDPDTLQSTACTRECEYAAALGRPILPILVSDGISADLLPAILKGIQFVDYRERNQDSAFRLARALTEIPKRGPLPDPLPASPVAPVSYLSSLSARVDAPELPSEEQSLLVVELKEAMRQPDNEADARKLLEKLRRRRDLYANVSNEIDEVLGKRSSGWLKVTAFVVGAIAIGIAVWQLMPEPQTPVAPVEFTVGEAKVAGERLAAGWLDAFKRGDLETVLAMSDIPFWLDNDMKTSMAELRQTLSPILEGDRSQFQTLEVDRFQTWSIREYREEGLSEGDRVIGRLSLDDDDIVVAIFIESEGIALFFRNANRELRLVAWWD